MGSYVIRCGDYRIVGSLPIWSEGRMADQFSVLRWNFEVWERRYWTTVRRYRTLEVVGRTWEGETLGRTQDVSYYRCLLREAVYQEAERWLLYRSFCVDVMASIRARMELLSV